MGKKQVAQATVDWLDTKAQAVEFMVALAERYTRGEIELQSLTKARGAMLKEQGMKGPKKGAHAKRAPAECGAACHAGAGRVGGAAQEQPAADWAGVVGPPLSLVEEAEGSFARAHGRDPVTSKGRVAAHGAYSAEHIGTEGQPVQNADVQACTAARARGAGRGKLVQDGHAHGK